MFAQMCEAVAACHDTSVLHRDIKSENSLSRMGGRLIRMVSASAKLSSSFPTWSLHARSRLMDYGSASTPYMRFGTIPILHYLYLFGLSLFTECRNDVALHTIPVPQMPGPHQHVRIPLLFLMIVVHLCYL